MTTATVWSCAIAAFSNIRLPSKTEVGTARPRLDGRAASVTIVAQLLAVDFFEAIETHALP